MSNYATLLTPPKSSGGAGGEGSITSIRFNGQDYTPDDDGLVVFNQVQADWAAETGPSFIQNKPALFSGDYNDLQNRPTIPAAQVPSDWNATEGPSEILNKPVIPAAQVPADWDATEGPAQILNKPTIPDAQVQADWDAVEAPAAILNKPNLSALPTAVQGGLNLGDGVEVYKQKVGTVLQFKTLVAGANTSIVPSEDGLTLVISSTGTGGGGEGVQSLTFNGVSYLPDEDGRITFSGATTAQGAKADTALQSADVAPVAISGNYNDLSNLPTIPAAQVPADWDATSGVAQILNKPTIPAAQVQSDWNATTGVAAILNKPTIPAAPKDLVAGSNVSLVEDATTIQINVSFSGLVTQTQWDGHVGQLGITQHPVASATQAGFMPPVPQDDKIYGIRNGVAAEVVSGGGGTTYDRTAVVFAGGAGTTWEEVAGEWFAFNADATNLFPTISNAAVTAYPRDPTFLPATDQNGNSLAFASPVVSQGTNGGVTLHNNFKLAALSTGTTASGACVVNFNGRAPISVPTITKAGFNVEFSILSQATAAQNFSVVFALQCAGLYITLESRGTATNFRLWLTWNIVIAGGNEVFGELNLGWDISGAEHNQMVADLDVTFTATTCSMKVTFSNPNVGLDNVTLTHTVNAARVGGFTNPGCSAGIYKSVGTTAAYLYLRRMRGYLKTT